MTPRGRAFTILRHAVLVVWTLVVLFPIFWMVQTSFKDAGDWVSWPTRWLPFVDFEPTLLNYRQIFYFGGSTDTGALRREQTRGTLELPRLAHVPLPRRRDLAEAVTRYPPLARRLDMGLVRRRLRRKPGSQLARDAL